MLFHSRDYRLEVFSIERSVKETASNINGLAEARLQ